MAKEITTTPEIVTLQEQFLQAKSSKDQWAEYQRSVEDALLSKLVEIGVELPITGTLDLEKVIVSFGTTRKWDEFALAELAAANPHVIGSTLKVSYSPAITKPKVDALLKSGTPFAAALVECFQDKPKKPGFTCRK